MPPARVAGFSVEGRPIDYRVWGDGDQRVLIIASIHGDEPAGTPLVKRLEREMGHDPDLLAGRTVVIVPVANPDGYRAGRRRNANGVDLNRNFPAENFRHGRGRGTGPLSEPESRALHDVITRWRPDRIVSIHQPLACIDWDGPGRELARTMGEVSDLPVRRIGGRPGSLGSWVGATLGVPIVTLELPGGAQRLDQDELWNRYGPVLIAAIE